MAVRNSFTSFDTPNPEFDPSMVMNMPLPPGMATPFDGGTGEPDPTTPISVPPPQPDIVPKVNLPPVPSTTGQMNLTPGYTPPPPGPNASAPRPSVNPSVVYTDQGGTGYDPPALFAAWQNPAFKNDPANARVGDILAQYGLGGNTGASAGPKPTASLSPAPNFGTQAGFSLPDSALGDTVDSGLSSLIGNHGMTPEQTSLLTQLNKIIAGGGALPGDDQLEHQQLETARENEAQAFGAQLGDARNELASHGLVGEPGVPQGSEGEAIDNITRTTAPAYAQAVRDVSSKQIDTQNTRLLSAISSATGLTGDAARNLVTSLGTGSQRQLGLAGIALDSLSQNMQWNQFLANYGLNRDQLLNSIQNGNVSSLMTLISLFEQTAGASAGGHI